MSEFEYNVLFNMYKDLALHSAWHLRKTINVKSKVNYNQSDLYRLSRDIQLYQCKKYGMTLCGHDVRYTIETKNKENRNAHRREMYKRKGR